MSALCRIGVNTYLNHSWGADGLLVRCTRCGAPFQKPPLREPNSPPTAAEMSDKLSELEQARARFRDAAAEYQACEESEHEHGDPIPHAVTIEFRLASAALRDAERRHV